jgi:hypothetical protein
MFSVNSRRNPMKTKHRQPSRQARDAFDSELRQKRMAEYLKATQASFEAAVVRASMLGQAANGVLVGPVVRT